VLDRLGMAPELGSHQAQGGLSGARAVFEARTEGERRTTRRREP
jgi:hypothetical protein